MAADPQVLRDMLLEFRWLDAVVEFLTGGGSETLAIVMPSMLYGSVMAGYFVVGRSPIIPVVLSIVFAALVFAYIPSAIGQIVGLAVLGMLATGGLILMWRIGT